MQEPPGGERGAGGYAGPAAVGQFEHPGVGQPALRPADGGGGGVPLLGEVAYARQFVARLECPRAYPLREVRADFPIAGHVCTIYPCTVLK